MQGVTLPLPRARLLVLDFDGFQGDGFASIVHRTASAIAEAFYENRSVVLGPTPLAYKPGPWTCEEHDLLYFLPFSSCSLEDSTADERVWRPRLLSSSSGMLVQASLYLDSFDDASRLKLSDEVRTTDVPGGVSCSSDR
eukprot:764225-Hanusia_phi.AAC.2